MLKSGDYTLNTMCNIIWSPAFPGYFPAILAAVRSNMFAPVSVQTHCTSIFFPTPRGPAIRTDLTSGDFSCTAWDPARQITGKDRNVKIQPISQPIIFACDQELALKGKVCPGTISCEAARRLKLNYSEFHLKWSSSQGGQRNRQGLSAGTVTTKKKKTKEPKNRVLLEINCLVVLFLLLYVICASVPAAGT